MPMPSRWSSVAGAVMLFHSPMSRMKRTRPEAVDGEMDPNTASWRSHHGDITSTNRATQPTAAANGMAGRGRPSAPDGPGIQCQRVGHTKTRTAQCRPRVTRSGVVYGAGNVGSHRDDRGECALVGVGAPFGSS